ncbi:MotE family protein [Poseidonocella sedimentorum]|uniref:Flagellar motility protein MotE, a chaperone for MotC folding n=1 Tax=Poseidonocella sedimentorum TaxID=871652 RepID=A0A1I6D5I0_9RHOB|nr:hypothetical protein [Poseidonocella sedimentorum]SFR00734.1 Flagellar motility protein MotE, a chaperone for MotC folding [Poseidonocella sedimentorum]
MAKAKQNPSPKGKSKVKSRATRGALFTLAVMLFASAFLRIGPDAGQAIALEFSKATSNDADETVCEPPEDVVAVLSALQERAQHLDTQEADVSKRLKTLSVARREIDAKLEQLAEAEAKLAATIAQAEAASEGDLGQLTAVYEAMKPKDAAKLFENMEPEFAAGFLGRMRPESAAGVMAGLSAQFAYSVSVVLAGRNAGVPKQ